MLSRLLRSSRKMPKLRFSTASSKPSEQTQQKPSAEEIPEEEIDLEEHEVEFKPNPYWLWFKRLVKLYFLYQFADIVYTFVQQKKMKDLEWRFFEVYPFYNWSMKVLRGWDSSYDFLTKPPIVKFLPEKMPIKGENMKKVLVLNFEGTLYSKDFESGKGIIVHLRPGFRKFLEEARNHYEVIIYSDEETNVINQMLQTISPMDRLVIWAYGREFMSWSMNGPKKNLNFVNRDPKKIIAVDLSRDIYLNNKECVVQLPAYNGEEVDNKLNELSLFLKYLSNPAIKDVKAEIEKFGGVDAVTNFAQKVQKKATSKNDVRGKKKKDN